ncbi:UrcA family protein [Brevundimonas sp.]|uniref:UrcA family protein n=1 Tax=Brevundimonas sp. TaxID=1871086 RepID=UPI002BE862D5|nr:UrcA family protein [Brevundimonas sp.]HWQ87441.1 UrcA family protein [Brevundimonas sp.]
MRPLVIVCGLLLAACSTTVSARSEEPAPKARFHYADLNLRDPADRRVLVARVDQAAADYCRSHSDIVTPYHRRADASYCPASIRAQLMWAMPPRVRHAYDSGWARRPAG